LSQSCPGLFSAGGSIAISYLLEVGFEPTHELPRTGF
jgi:hypothetical protein